MVVNKADIWDYSLDGQSVLLTPLNAAGGQPLRLDYREDRLILSGSQPEAVYQRFDESAAQAPADTPTPRPLRRIRR